MSVLQENIPLRYLAWVLVIGIVVGALGFPLIAMAGPSSVTLSENGLHPHLLLPDNRIVIGTVQHIKEGVMQVNIGELEPLFLTAQDAAERGMTSIERGDKLEIVLTNNDLPIDYHLVGQPGWDRVVRGTLLQPLVGDHKWALIRKTQGKVEPFEMTEDSLLKVFDIPVGAPALFLLDKHNIIIDATSGGEARLLNALTQWSKERQRLVHF